MKEGQRVPKVRVSVTFFYARLKVSVTLEKKKKKRKRNGGFAANNLNKILIQIMRGSRVITVVIPHEENVDSYRNRRAFPKGLEDVGLFPHGTALKEN
jgi:hypothetical protein